MFSKRNEFKSHLSTAPPARRNLSKSANPCVERSTAGDAARSCPVTLELPAPCLPLRTEVKSDARLAAGPRHADVFAP